MSAGSHTRLTTENQVRNCPLCHGEGTLRFRALGNDRFYIACGLCGEEEEFRDTKPGYGGNSAVNRWAMRARRRTPRIS